MSEQQIAWQVSLALMTLVAFAFIFVAINSGKREDDYSLVQKSGYSIRTKLFWVLAVVFGTAMLYNLRDLPYSAGPTPTDASAVQVIEAKGYQWRWELSSNRVAVDHPVEFRVSSADVNHGFAIYDAGMHIVAQTQAMPGYINKLNYTFRKKGIYRILCLEYCGTAHHNMMTEINVGDL